MHFTEHPLYDPSILTHNDIKSYWCINMFSKKHGLTTVRNSNGIAIVKAIKDNSLYNSDKIWEYLLDHKFDFDKKIKQFKKLMKTESKACNEECGPHKKCVEYTDKEIFMFLFHLYCTQSLNGAKAENIFMSDIDSLFSKVNLSEVLSITGMESGDEDEKFGIDCKVIYIPTGDVFCGISVKAESYIMQPEENKRGQKVMEGKFTAHYNSPTFTALYRQNPCKFINLSEVFENILGCI